MIVARLYQKSSNRLLSMQLRKAMMALAPSMLQCIPEHLRRVPITCLQPASTTPELTQSAEDKLRTFAALPRHTYRWKRLHKKHSALERINTRVGRDFQLERHYMRRLETMQMRVALSLSVILAMACTSIREGQPQRMRSVIHPLAA